MGRKRMAGGGGGSQPWHLAAWLGSAEPCLVYGMDDGRVVDANPAASLALKTPFAALVGARLEDCLEAGCAERLQAAAAEAGELVGRPVGQWSPARSLGPPVQFDVVATTLPGAQRLCLLRLAEASLEAAETPLRRLTWALGAYARSSSALIRFATFEELVGRICEAVVGEDDYLLAAVGSTEAGPGKPIRIMAAAGRAAAYAHDLVLSWSEDAPGGCGPAGIAVRSGEPFVMRDSFCEAVFEPWRDKARGYGIRSSVTVPFHCDGRPCGVVMVYAGRPDAFGEQEMEVFVKLGQELAFARTVAEERVRLKAAEEARRTAEEAARDSQAELARAGRALTVGAYASSIAHEINQPIAAIAANSDTVLRWLAAEPPRLDEARTALQRIIRDADRASGVLGRTRAMLTKSPASRQAVDIREILSEALQFTLAERRRAGVEVETDFAGDLPPVLADRIQVQQVAVNLIVNAIDAMKAVRDRARVLTVSAGPRGDGEVMVRVADTGVGLDPEGAGRVFEHLFTTKPDGIGLGLPISRAIIEDHGGRIGAEPNAPFGAVFSFVLPAAGAADA